MILLPDICLVKRHTHVWCELPQGLHCLVHALEMLPARLRRGKVVELIPPVVDADRPDGVLLTWGQG
jgi:hypothetical protein